MPDEAGQDGGKSRRRRQPFTTGLSRPPMAPQPERHQRGPNEPSEHQRLGEELNERLSSAGHGGERRQREQRHARSLARVRLAGRVG